MPLLHNMIEPSLVVDYAGLLRESGDRNIEETIGYLAEELPYLWCDAYKRMSERTTDICRFWHTTFEYIFDDSTGVESTGSVATMQTAEPRLVAVVGLSNPMTRVRDDSRLRGWIGRTEAIFGPRWDKGHFIGHSLGGAVDGIEANVFLQRRDLNRGWSKQGRSFRAMEKYCATKPRTFCFSRPIYRDESARPTFLEFGVLKERRDLWVECFDNR